MVQRATQDTRALPLRKFKKDLRFKFLVNFLKTNDELLL